MTAHRRFATLLPILVLVLSTAASSGQTDPLTAPPTTRPDETAAPADAESSVAKAPTVVVSATRTTKDPFEAPASVDVLNFYELINRRLARTTPEALAELPGIMIQKTSHGQGAPYLRGLTGYHTVFLIDGIRLNNSTFRAGPNQYWGTVDPLTIQRLEVVRGAGSVLYGSDAIGGVVNAITREGDLGGDGLNWKRRLFYRLSTAERSHVGRAEISGSLDRCVSMLLGGDFKHFGDVEAGGGMGRQPKTGYEEWDGDVKFVFQLDPKSRLVLAHQQNHQNNAWRTHQTVYARSFHDSEVGTELKRIIDQDRQLTYLQYHADDLGGCVDAIHASLSYQLQEEYQHRLRSNGRTDEQGTEVGTVGAWVQLETPSPIGRWTYGVEHYHDNVNSFRKDYNADGSFRSQSIQGPVADDAGYDLFGAFIQDEIPIGRRLDVTLGGRFTWARLNANKVQDPATGDTISMSDQWTSAVGSARVLYRLTDQWHLFGGVSQGFRAPNLSDLTRLDTARSSEIETPVPGGLDPERFVAYEAGVKARYQQFSGQAAYFFTDIDGMIIRAPTGAIIDGLREVTKRNAGNGFLHGVELAARYQLCPQWTVFGNAAWMDGEVDAYPGSDPLPRSETIDRLMPATGTIGVRWEHPRRRHWIEWVATLADAADDLSTRDALDTQRIPPGGTPGYLVMSIRSGWELRQGLNLTVSLENLTNESYRTHGSGQNEPGISLNVGVDWEF